MKEINSNTLEHHILSEKMSMATLSSNETALDEYSTVQIPHL